MPQVVITVCSHPALGQGDDMARETVIEELQRLGMSGYEAKSYLALVVAGGPLNGYEVAKRSGVPRSTVYETLSKLVGRGAAYEVRAGEAGVGYIALPPTTLLDRMRRDFDHSIDTVRAALAEAASPSPSRLVHDLSDRSSLLARAEDVVAAARKNLLVSGWLAEVDALKPLLQRAEADGVEVSVMTFGEDRDPVGRTMSHRYSPPETVLGYLGCRLLVVAADREQAVIGGAVDDRAWGMYTDDPAVVLVAVDYVRHDIVVHLIADRLPDEFQRFWADDPDVRRLRAEHGVPSALLTRPRGGGTGPRRSPSP